jgi:hypothetical protein
LEPTILGSQADLVGRGQPALDYERAALELSYAIWI